jgi:hypothetical protein
MVNLAQIHNHTFRISYRQRISKLNSIKKSCKFINTFATLNYSKKSNNRDYHANILHDSLYYCPIEYLICPNIFQIFRGL